MLFRPRTSPSFVSRIRIALWPRRSWARSIRYIALRLQRVPSSPHSVALGFALGVFVVFTPFVGLQLIISIVLAWMLRGSVLAAIMGSFLGNPLTYPPIWIATYSLGSMLIDSAPPFQLAELHHRAGDFTMALESASLSGIARTLQHLWQLLKPMAAGALPVGGLAALLSYVGVRRFVSLSRAI
ncbi:MAG: DUF2062 domain-containing protein [Alphaproteobacteria bacterium]|jgi:uncharacterized protein